MSGQVWQPTHEPRPLHKSHFTCMLRRLKAPAVGRGSQSVIDKHKLPIPWVFATSASEITFRAEVSSYYLSATHTGGLICLTGIEPAYVCYQH